MGRQSPRGRFNALALLSDVRRLVSSRRALDDVLIGSAPMISIIRHTLEKRTPTEFLSALHDQLVKDGLEPDRATAALDEVVNRPTLAVSRNDRERRESTILHGVLLQEEIGEQCYLVTVELVVHLGKPPTVDPSAVSVGVWSVVLNGSGPADLVTHVESLWAEYGVREVSAPPQGGLERVTVLGDPETTGYVDVPGGWQTRLTTSAGVLGMTTTVIRTPGALRSQALDSSGFDVVLVFGDPAGWKKLLDVLAPDGVAVVRVGQPGESFEGSLAGANARLLSLAMEAIAPPSTAPRELEPGETVYHRKVRDSRGGFDQFDEGSDKPCLHDSFVRWRSADKAFKGMQRIYSNMTKSMLYHCSKAPGCGMYMVARAHS